MSTPGIKITTILCFGLGDVARESPEVYIAPNKETRVASERAEIHPAIIQHAAALIMAEDVRVASDSAIRLLCQDPQYSDNSHGFLRSKGFGIVGNFGAAGFGYVDEQCLIFAAWPSVPVKQIVADVERPAIFITLDNERSPFNRFK